MELQAITQLLREAHGYVALEMYADAWQAMERLPLPLQTMRPVILMRILVCAGMKFWEGGYPLLNEVGPADPESHREAVGCFHLAHADALGASGDLSGAKAALDALVFIWPEGRSLAQDCIQKLTV